MDCVHYNIFLYRLVKNFYLKKSLTCVDKWQTLLSGIKKMITRKCFLIEFLLSMASIDYSGSLILTSKWIRYLKKICFMDPSSSKIYFFLGYRHTKSWFQLFPPDNLTMKVVKFSIPLYVRFEHENMIFFKHL